MSTVAPVILTIVHGVVALVALLVTLRSLRVQGRVVRLATRPISSLSGGAAEIVGHLTAEHPIATVDGPLAAVLRTEIEIAYNRGAKTYRDPWAVDRVSASRCAIHDGTGVLEVRADVVLPLAETKQRNFTPEHLNAERPDLWQLVAGKEEKIVEVRIRETYVPHNVTVFASGELEETGESTAGSDYRDTRRKLRLHGTDRHPLILSPFSEKDVRAKLLQPAVLLGWAALLSLAAIAALWLVRAAIGGIAGIG